MKTEGRMKSAPCVIQESPEGTYLIYNLRSEHGSSLQTWLSEDHRRLHIVGSRQLESEMDQFLWTFNIPASADASGIEVREKNQLYLIFIPRKNPLKKAAVKTRVYDFPPALAI